jgi:hypothetical protein
MTNNERIEHLMRWNEKNWDITDYLPFHGVLELWDIFKDTNREYTVQDCIEEHFDGELVEKYNQFAEKYNQLDMNNGKLNKFINGEWELTY